MDGTIASPLDLIKDLCGCPLNPKDLLCFRQTSFTSNRKWHKSFGFEGLPSDLKTAPDLYMECSNCKYLITGLDVWVWSSTSCCFCMKGRTSEVTICSTITVSIINSI